MKISNTILTSVAILLFVNQIAAQDCNCEAALRYDIYASTNTELSEHAC
jgi:hypothetical protein